MSLYITQPDYTIVFNEERNFVEMRYQGVNADMLAAMSARLAEIEQLLGITISGVEGNLGTFQISVTALQALVNSMSLDLNNETLARIALGEATTANILDLQNDYLTRIQAETNARGAAILAEAEARGVAIGNAIGTLVTDHAALVVTVQGIAASLGTANASIIEVQEAIATESGARASEYATLQANLGQNSAAVLAESTARVTAYDTLAEQISMISATSGTTVFMQPDEPTTGMIAGDLWYDTDDGNKPYRYSGTAWVDTTDIRITQNAAAVISEQQARIYEDGLLASSITITATNLETLIDGVAQNASALVTAEQSARISAIGDIEAKYTIKVDINGHISGFGLIGTENDGVPYSEFVVTADAFKIFNGTDPISPFQVIDGVVYMNNAIITNATIETLEVDKLVSGTLLANILQNADWSVGSGRIVFDSNPGAVGGYIKITGIGFGPLGNYLEWFGPKPSNQVTVSNIIANLSDATAIQYLKTNGDAYFGGSLSAGVLKNAATSTSLVLYPEVVIGPFATNGHSKQVVVSFTAADNTTQMNIGNSTGINTGTVTIYRAVGGGAETVWATMPLSGTWTKEDQAPGVDPGFGVSNLYGTITLTDNDSSLLTRTYRAVVTAKSMVAWGTLREQKLSIISTEI